MLREQTCILDFQGRIFHAATSYSGHGTLRMEGYPRIGSNQPVTWMRLSSHVGRVWHTVVANDGIGHDQDLPLKEASVRASG